MLLVDLAIRSSIIVLVGLVMSARLRGRSAALRHLVLAATVFASAAVVPLSRAVPAWDVPMLAAPARSWQPPLAPVTPIIEESATVDVATPIGFTSLSLVASIWAVGFALGAAMLLTGLGRLAWIASRAERVRDPRWHRLTQHVVMTYGLRREVAILQSDAPDVLATWGVWRPRVLLPAHARGWSDERAHVVLCHELAHIRRNDWLVQIGAELLRTTYWFNPLLWLACTRLRRESEQACDDIVLGAGVPAHEYAAHLLDLARSCRRAGPRLASAMPMARASTLERRIAAMLKPDLDRRALSGRAIAITAVLLLGLALPTAAVRPAQNAPLPLTGFVYDASGAVLPGVALTLQDAQELTWQTTSDASGRFEFPPVATGRYVLEASLSGFRALRHELDLNHDRDWHRAVTLQVGDVTETVVVRERRVADAQAVSPAQTPVPVRVGGQIRPPRKIHDVRPVYPSTMRDAGLEGIVPIEAIIGRDGAVRSVRVLSAHVHPDLARAAVDAVRQWRYDATLLNGVPVEVVMTVSVDFGLSE